jgi:transposase-like protein
MKRSRKPYPDEFKQEAVRLLREQRLPRSQVARDLSTKPPARVRRTQQHIIMRQSRIGDDSVELLSQLAPTGKRHTAAVDAAQDQSVPDVSLRMCRTICRTMVRYIAFFFDMIRIAKCGFVAS